MILGGSRRQPEVDRVTILGDGKKKIEARKMGQVRDRLMPLEAIDANVEAKGDVSFQRNK